jgi:hypothetical protein
VATEGSNVEGVYKLSVHLREMSVKYSGILCFSLPCLCKLCYSCLASFEFLYLCFIPEYLEGCQLPVGPHMCSV